jgi:hypothetical protein
VLEIADERPDLAELVAEGEPQLRHHLHQPAHRQVGHQPRPWPRQDHLQRGRHGPRARDGITSATRTSSTPSACGCSPSTGRPGSCSRPSTTAASTAVSRTSSPTSAPSSPEQAGRPGGVSRPMAAVGLRPMPTKRWSPGNRPHPPVELEAIAARWERRRSRRPCHSRAISSGHERYAAVNHGHSVRATELGAAH